jgi:ATP-dependent DNA helicase RecQ
METAKKALKKYFGYDAFRPMQADVIRTICEQRRDALVLMPTGGGKSVCFQIPAVISDGVAIVVSPLISLMKDQVEALLQNGIPAAYFNSSQSPRDQQIVENQLFAGKLKLLYVSPEKMVSAGFVSALRSLPISLFAIDEAHCISSWGHDFRPEYAQMQFLKQQFPKIPVIALTATADRLTRKDIIEKLALNNPEVFIGSFDRPNLSLEVRAGQKRFEQIVDFLKDHPRQAGIIYCLSRKSTEDLSERLKLKGYNAACYHAALPNETRSKVQEDFLNDKLLIVVATIAFGMGIDKSNVRWVIHYNLPKNIESYYQEIGRAGRDGAPAETLLFYSMADVNTYQSMFADAGGENQQLQGAKLDRMLKFADAAICRRKILLNYFNEHLPDNCDNCDVCKHPPRYFDGTKPVQMALSAVYRLKESVNMTTLSEVLKGSAKAEIMESGYQHIKTYGAGRMYTYPEWSSYLWQMIQLGLLEIAYDEKNVLKFTPQSRAVLFDNKVVELVQPMSFKDRQNARAKELEVKQLATPKLLVRNALFEALRELRSETARERGVPPYLIFSDKTLAEMAGMLPKTEFELMLVSGVGDQKMQQYGDVFLKEIQKFLKQNPNFEPSIPLPKPAEMEKTVEKSPKIVQQNDSSVDEKKEKSLNIIEKTLENLEKDTRYVKIVEKAEKPVKMVEKKGKEIPMPKIPTVQQTLTLYRQGLTIEEIAEQRFLSPITINSHLTQIYEQSDELEITDFIPLETLNKIVNVLPSLTEPFKFKEIYEYFGETVGYEHIRWAVAYYQKTKEMV